MRYLLLIVFLTVVQATAPVSRHIRNSPANRPSVQETQTDTQHPVVVRELPPLTINTRRDWADWGTWLFTCLLAITSMLQVWLLCRTLVFARRQTHEIKRQRSYMRLQWKAMRDQINLAEKQFLLTNRPWVTVTGAIQNGDLFVDDRGLVSISISYSVKNGGAAPAIGTMVLNSELIIGPLPRSPLEARQTINCSKNPDFILSSMVGVLVIPGDSFETKDYLVQTRILQDFTQPQEVWFTQCIRYTDELGELHGTGLLWRFESDGERAFRIRKSSMLRGQFVRIGIGNESY